VWVGDSPVVKKIPEVSNVVAAAEPQPNAGGFSGILRKPTRKV